MLDAILYYQLDLWFTFLCRLSVLVIDQDGRAADQQLSSVERWIRHQMARQMEELKKKAKNMASKLILFDALSQIKQKEAQFKGLTGKKWSRIMM